MDVAELNSQLDDISDLSCVDPSFRRDKADVRFSNTKQKTQSYLTVLQALLTAPNVQAEPLITLGRHLTTTPSMAMVVGRRVLGAFVAALCAGSGLDNVPAAEDAGDVDWVQLGEQAFTGTGEDVRSDVVRGVLDEEGMGGWCEEQVRFAAGMS